jgi:hypothetical protein
MNTPHITKNYLAILVLLVLASIYTLTLQTHISGSFQESTAASILKNEYIKDVAEIQVALNVWGTIHHTGYPLFAILGNVFTLPLRTLGIEPAAAASLYAAAWGAVTLGSFGLLIWRLTGQALLAALGVALLGVARSIWIHHVIAEVYSMSLAITMLMLLVALWPAPWHGPKAGQWSVERRVLWLALLGGIGVAHHRAVAFVAPGLLLAIWPHLWAVRDEIRWRRLTLAAVGLGAIGFLPYIYLPLRAHQDAAWVYGEPGTLHGLWIEFTGQEADRLVTLPADLAGLWDNVQSVWDILVHELTLPGLLIGVFCLMLAMVVSDHRRAARIVALSAAGPTLFAVLYHTAVLPEAILMPTVLALVFGVVLNADWLRELGRNTEIAALAGIAVWAGILVGWHYGYIDELVTEPSGVHTIDRMARLPDADQSALMFPWGPRYAAAMYAKLVTGQYADRVIVDHKADFHALLNEGYRLYTEPETFYTYAPPWQSAYGAPSSWWTDRIGPITLTSAVPGYVQILNSPWLATGNDRPGEPVLDGILRRDAWLTCDSEHIFLTVIWGADARPTSDPSIFVHLTPDEPIPNPPNADSRHPVYGSYPFVEWSPAEIVRDDYILPRRAGMTQVRFGLYEPDGSGQFVNYGETVLPVAACEAVSW